MARATFSPRDPLTLGFEISRPARGFTLVELLVVILIFAVLLGLVARAYHDGHRQMELQGALQRLQTAMVQARADALASGSRMAVVFHKPAGENTDDDWYAVVPLPIGTTTLPVIAESDRKDLPKNIDFLALTYASEGNRWNELDEDTRAPLWSDTSDGEGVPHAIVFSHGLSDTLAEFKYNDSGWVDVPPGQLDPEGNLTVSMAQYRATVFGGGFVERAGRLVVNPYTGTASMDLATPLELKNLSDSGL